MDTWWENDREILLNLAAKETPLYVYSEKVIRNQINKLKVLTSVSKFFYAVKANFQKDILKLLYNEGFGFECVSPGEIENILKLFPKIDTKRILFTPNFVPKEEYIFGFSKGVIVNIDSVYPLEQWPEIFKGQSIFLRIDTGTGRGHHDYVKTAGKHSKFGIITELAQTVSELSKRYNFTVTGLHAHVGSGILSSQNWNEVAHSLYQLKQSYFPTVTILNLGGGFGVVQNPTTDSPLDMSAVAVLLSNFKKNFSDVELMIEPGRYLVAESGVLVCKVTQIKKKEETKHYIGVNTGFNSLIRPILYSAYHHCVNLTRINEPLNWNVDVVGMICESGDVLAANRPFPICYENDIIILTTAGAYGSSMSNNYNQRQPAREYFLPIQSNPSKL